MRKLKLITALVFCVTAAAAAALAEEKKEGKSLKVVLDELLPGMGAEQGYEGPQQQWQEICFQAGAPGNEARRAEAGRLMAEKLGPQTPVRARIWLLTQLERIGREECVGAVAAVLDDKDPLVRDAACRALANNPAPDAGAKLRAKLAATADNKLKIALANALGFRAEPASASVLGKELQDPDTAVAAAAASALGKIATSEAAAELRRAPVNIEGEFRLRFLDACLRCADRLLREGSAAEAGKIYAGIARHAPPNEPIRLAIMQGRLNAASDQAPAIILEVLAGSDAGTAEVALGHLAKLKGEAIRSLAEGLPKLSPIAQVALLNALGWRRDAAALPGVRVVLLKSPDEKVEIAALRALGGVGDASVVPLLVELMFAGGRTGGAARESLDRLFAQGADEKLAAMMKAAKDPGQRGQLIEVLDRRRAEVAVPALLEEALGPDEGIRRRAMAALGRLAAARDVAGMLKAMAKTQDAGEREEIERAVLAVASRVPDEAKQAEPVLAVYRAASEAEKNALLPLLGRIGGADALDLARAALASADPARCEAGVRALCNWPDADAAADLLKLAESAKDQSQRVRALRAFVRVGSLRDDRPNEERLGLLKRAMPLAGRNEDRAWILERAAAIRSVDTLRFVVGYLDNPELAQQACRTIVELAHHRDLREPNKAEFTKALDRVIQVAKDNGLVQRAKNYRAGR